MSQDSDVVEFKFQRYAALTLEKTAMQIDEGQLIYHEDVGVELRKSPQAPSKTIMIATSYFDAIRISGAWDDHVVAARRRAERAISAVADVLSIASCGGRSIESCSPHFSVTWPLGTSPDVGDDWVMRKLPTVIEPAGNKYVDLANLVGGVQDRLSGVSLLSLALSNSNGLGKFLGLCRFFEDAFALSVSQLVKKLSQFLKSNPLDLRYSADEVSSWLKFRDGASHGDLAVATEHVVESDVLKFIPRMQQAGFDVLLNKKSWHDKSRERRIFGRPSIVFRTDPIHIIATVGRPLDYGLKLVDPFCEWPIALDCSVSLTGAVWPKLDAPFPTTIECIPP